MPASSGKKRPNQQSALTSPTKSVRFQEDDSPTKKQKVSSTPHSARKEITESVISVLNDDIPQLDSKLSKPTLRTNVDKSKFNHRIMYEKMSDCAEYLDEQIEAFTRDIQKAYNLTNEDFGNPASVSPNDIYVVGRILPDAATDLNSQLKSVSIQPSRKNGAGMRIELRFPPNLSTHFFPGQIIAAKGSNASGSYFFVNQLLDLPLLPPVGSSTQKLKAQYTVENHGGLKIFTAAGPFTGPNDLDFTPLKEMIYLIRTKIKPNVVILFGPFISYDHPLIAKGDFTVYRPRTRIKMPNATLDEFFKCTISNYLRKIDPSVSIVLIPHVSDTASPHPAFPQPAFNRKLLELPKNVYCQTNPATFSLNEVVISACSQDTLFALARTSYKLNNPPNIFQSWMKDMIVQRNMFPVYPGLLEEKTGLSTDHKIVSGSNLDIPYLGLADFNKALPDVFITPSKLKCPSQTIENVVVINPGVAARKEYATVSIHPYNVEELTEDKQYTTNDVYKRVRVETAKIQVNTISED